MQKVADEPDEIDFIPSGAALPGVADRQDEAEKYHDGQEAGAEQDFSLSLVHHVCEANPVRCREHGHR